MNEEFEIAGVIGTEFVSIQIICFSETELTTCVIALTKNEFAQ